MIVVADGAHFHALGQRAEVELRAVRRRVARENLLPFDPELHALDRRLDVDVDDEQVRRHVAPRRNDAHRAAALRHHPLGDDRLGTFVFAGDVGLVRLRDRERLRCLSHDHRRLLFKRHHEPRLELRRAGRQRLDRRDRGALRRIDRIAEVLDHRAALRDRSDDDQRHAGRDGRADDEAIRRAHDHPLRRVAKGFEGDSELAFVGCWLLAVGRGVHVGQWPTANGQPKQQRERNAPHDFHLIVQPNARVVWVDTGLPASRSSSALESPVVRRSSGLALSST